jgi:hypothetical protein
MNTKPNIKKPWLKPFVKVVSVRKDTYAKTLPPKEGGTDPDALRRALL